MPKYKNYSIDVALTDFHKAFSDTIDDINAKGETIQSIHQQVYVESTDDDGSRNNYIYATIVVTQEE